MLATLVGCGLAWGGFILPALKPLYAYGWFVGFFASGMLYWALSGRREPESGRRKTRAEPRASVLRLTLNAQQSTPSGLTLNA